MKTTVLCVMALLAVAPVFAQTAAPSDPTNKTVTLTGCVGSGTDSSGFILGNAMVIPGTAQPGQIDRTPSPLPPTAPPQTTPATGATAVPAATAAMTPPPASTVAQPGTVPPAAAPAQVAPPASPAAVPQPASPAQVPRPAAPGTAPAPVGTSGTTPTSVTGTSGGVTAGTAVTPSSAVGGYRLSGTDMTSWSGQRVQVVGTFTPSSATAAGTTTTGGSGAPAAPPLEFRVQSVQPMSGPCPK